LLGGMTEIPSTPWRSEPWTLDQAIKIAPAIAEWAPLAGTVRHGFTHFRLELAIIAGNGEVEGMWSQVDRLGEHALPTLMKKVVRHAVSALEPRAGGLPANRAAARRTAAIPHRR
jgi:A/G-specific adenine glycosylase